jgi:hypothetical protein
MQKRIYIVQVFRRFSHSCWSHAFGQGILEAKVYMTGEFLYLIVTRNKRGRERERERQTEGERASQDSTFKGMPTLIHFFQRDPTS